MGNTIETFVAVTEYDNDNDDYPYNGEHDSALGCMLMVLSCCIMAVMIVAMVLT